VEIQGPVEIPDHKHDFVMTPARVSHEGGLPELRDPMPTLDAIAHLAKAHQAKLMNDRCVSALHVLPVRCEITAPKATS
jgi:hypothetical protein